jgi:hypothetical protein
VSRQLSRTCGRYFKDTRWIAPIRCSSTFPSYNAGPAKGCQPASQKREFLSRIVRWVRTPALFTSLLVADQKQSRSKPKISVTLTYVEWHSQSATLITSRQAGVATSGTSRRAGRDASSLCGSRYPASRASSRGRLRAPRTRRLKGYADPSSNAEAMALKRAAAKFGLGLSFYHK